MPEETGACSAQVCPAPTGISGWKSTIFYEYMRGIELPEAGDDILHLFRLSGNLEAETGLLDHDTRGDLVGSDGKVRGGHIRGFHKNILCNRRPVCRLVSRHILTSRIKTGCFSLSPDSFSG